MHPAREHIPIYLAAIGPKNLELTGEIADGWLAIFFAPEHAAELLAHIAAGRAKARPRRSTASTSCRRCRSWSATTSRRAPTRSAATAALYIGGMGSREQNFYNQLAVRMGYDAEAAEVQELYLARDYAGAAAAVPFEFIDRTALIGPPERIADRLAAYADAGVTTLDRRDVRRHARGAARDAAHRWPRCSTSPGWGTERDSWFEAIVLGIVQGLTEFLPISSTGHLRIVPALAGWDDPGAAFTAVMQLGTMAAVARLLRPRPVADRRRRWCRARSYAPELRGTLDARLGWYIILGTIPIAVLGLAFKDQIETGARDLRIIGWVLILVRRRAVRRRPGLRAAQARRDLTLRDGLLFGLAQALALIPGVSRSGATITAGRSLSYTREAAARFSFLLSVPAVVLSGLYEARTIGDAGGAGLGARRSSRRSLAFVVGYASIAWLLRYLRGTRCWSSRSTASSLGVLVLALVYGGAVAAT